MAHDLTVWGAGTSRTMRVHWMMLELGLEYEFFLIRPRTPMTQSAEFIRLNPRRKVPVLRHGSFVLTESAAIIQYLSEAFANPDKVYAPDDAKGRAALNEWCYFVMSEIDAASLYVARRHEGLSHIYGEAPAAVEAAKRYFQANIEAMAPRIDERGPYLFGDRVSAADILLMTCLDWAVSLGHTLPVDAARYRERVARRPAYQAARERNNAE
jgi:glutathione S-transferase